MSDERDDDNYSAWADYPFMMAPPTPDDPFENRVWFAMKDIMDEVTAIFGDRAAVFAESVTQLHEWVKGREGLLKSTPGRYWVMVQANTGVGKVKDTAGPLEGSEIVVTR